MTRSGPAAQSKRDTRALKYGVVLACGTLKAWQLACIRELEASGHARLVCIINDSTSSFPPANVRDRAYERFCGMLDLPSQSSASTSALRQDRSDLLEIEAWLSPTDLDWKQDVRDLDLDFILLFGERAMGVELLDVARYGVWQFVHSDPAHLSTAAPCFWEIYHDHDVTGAMLLRMEKSDVGGVVLKSACFPTIRDSFEQNLEAAFAALPAWPAQVCRDINRGSATYFDDEPLPCAPVHYGVPSPLQILHLRALEAQTRFAHYVHSRFYSIDWNLFVLKGSPSEFIGADRQAEVTDLFPYTKGLYLADPCVVRRGARTYVMCEEYRYKTNLGVVAAFEVPSNGAARPQVAIEEPYHLSYPHVFEDGGEVFCVTESARAKKVCLYRSVEFPHRWEYVRTLLDDFRAADSTLLRFDNKLWLFCTGGEHPKRGDDTHLYIWYADDLWGEWTPHARNPVKIDVRSSRPAGEFFTHENVLYRPTQDCSRTYGGAIRINRIDKLTETDFKESVAGVIRPPATSYDKGIHTISSAGGWCIVDAKRYVFNPGGIVAVLRRAVKDAALRMGIPAETLRSLKRRLNGKLVPVAQPQAPPQERVV